MTKEKLEIKRKINGFKLFIIFAILCQNVTQNYLYLEGKGSKINLEHLIQKL